MCPFYVYHMIVFTPFWAEIYSRFNQFLLLVHCQLKQLNSTFKQNQFLYNLVVCKMHQVKIGLISLFMILETMKLCFLPVAALLFQPKMGQSREPTLEKNNL